MIKKVLLFALVYGGNLCAQQNRVTAVRDAFLEIATDARAAGQGDIGVATAADAFSQRWNPSKHLFSDEKFEIGMTQIVGNRNEEYNEFNQANINFYNQLDTRSAYGVGFRGYSYALIGNQFDQTGTEISVDASYSLRLSDTFVLSVGGRFIAINAKIPILDGFSDISSLYGIDVSGFYFGNEKAFNAFNGRWRAGFNASNLRGQAQNDNRMIEIYAPSTLRVGAGFDFIFNQDTVLGVTTEYKSLLESYIETSNGEPLDFGLEGSVMALGFEFSYQEKLMLRTGYSKGINRLTDSFASLGAGMKGTYVDVDVAYLLGISEEENPIRQKLRLSLSLNLEEILFL